MENLFGKRRFFCHPILIGLGLKPRCSVFHGCVSSEKSPRTLACLYRQPLKMTLRQGEFMSPSQVHSVWQSGEKWLRCFYSKSCPVLAGFNVISTYFSLGKIRLMFLFSLVGKLEGLNQWHYQRCPFLSIT